MMNDMVTVAVFTWAHEMAVVRARLEWEGIDCFAKDENIVAAHPLYSNLVGGIKLQVRAEDVERAREILIETGHLVPEPVEAESNGRALAWAAERIRFPAFTPALGKQLALAALILILVLLILLS